METSLLWLMGKSLAALAAVLALFAGMLWLMRRLQIATISKHTGTSHLKILQRLALDSRHALVEIEYDQQSLLIAVGPNGVTNIAQHARPKNKVVTEEAQ
ncbi:MAG: flagellar biosynthetic protein FliO [Mariprofundaceae bacterium]